MPLLSSCCPTHRRNGVLHLLMSYEDCLLMFDYLLRYCFLIGRYGLVLTFFSKRELRAIFSNMCSKLCYFYLLVMGIQ